MKNEKIEKIIKNNARHEVKLQAQEILTAYRLRQEDNPVPIRKKWWKRNSFRLAFSATAVLLVAGVAFWAINNNKSNPVEFVANNITDDPLQAASLQLLTSEQLLVSDETVSANLQIPFLASSNVNANDPAVKAYRKIYRLVNKMYQLRAGIDVTQTEGNFIYEGEIFQYRVNIANNYYLYYNGGSISDSSVETDALNGYYAGENGIYSFSTLLDGNQVRAMSLSDGMANYATTTFNDNSDGQQIKYSRQSSDQLQYALTYSYGYDAKNQNKVAWQYCFSAPDSDDITFVVEEDGNNLVVNHESNGKHGSFKVDNSTNTTSDDTSDHNNDNSNNGNHTGNAD